MRGFFTEKAEKADSVLRFEVLEERTVFAESTWVAAAGGAWTAGKNWNPDIPGAADEAIFSQPFIYDVTVGFAKKGLAVIHTDKLSVTAGSVGLTLMQDYLIDTKLTVGLGPTAQLTLTNGTGKAGNVVEIGSQALEVAVGVLAGSEGKLLLPVNLVNNGGLARSKVHLLADTITLGDSGTGELDIFEGNQAIAEGNVVLGNQVVGSGKLFVSGQGAKLTTASLLIVGDLGDGELEIDSRGHVDAEDVVLGWARGGRGEAVVEGQGSKLTTASQLIVGADGNGEFEIRSRGQVEAGGKVSIGLRDNGSGKMVVEGQGSKLTTADELVVGDDGEGELEIRSRGQVESKSGYIGGGGYGQVTVTGDGSRWTGLDGKAMEHLTIGFEDNVAGLDVKDGGLVRTRSMVVNADPDIAALLISGEGSKVVVEDDALLSSQALILAEGLLDAGRVYIASGRNQPTAFVSVMSGTVRAKNDLVVGDGRPGKLEITLGGRVTSNESNVGWSGLDDNPAGEALVNVAGEDSLWRTTEKLSIGSNAQESKVTVSEGALIVAGTIENGAKGVVQGGSLGKFQTKLFSNLGTVIVGFSPDTLQIVDMLQIKGDYTQDTAGRLEVELGGTKAGSEHDLLKITSNAVGAAGIATLSGTLDVSFLDGYQPTAGAKFDVLTAVGGIAGEFTTINLPELAPGLKWAAPKYGQNDADAEFEVTLEVITDPATPRIVVNPTGDLFTTEAGGTAKFTVVLNAQPTADVTVSLTSSDSTEGYVDQSSLIFTPDNWNTPQTVTITGVDDSDDDGDVLYEITTATAVSDDLRYSDMVVDDVSVTNIDDDASTSTSAGITVTETTGLTTTEAGGEAKFTVVLNSQPTHDVTIGVSSSKAAEGTADKTSLVFTPANWNSAQTVTVTGQNDDVDDGDQTYNIVLAAVTSDDKAYHGKNPEDVTLTNTDDDSAGIFVTPTSGLITTEAGGTDKFTVSLKSKPTADVIISVLSDNTAEGQVDKSSLVFTPENWNQVQTVEVTGQNDAVADGNAPYSITLGTAASDDSKYSGVEADDVAVTNTDNDTVGITVSAPSSPTTSENGTTSKFTVVLNSQPLGDVTVSVSSSDQSEGKTDKSSLTFTSGNWNTPQTVTVTGQNDFETDGSQPYTISVGPATSTSDSSYDGYDPLNVSLTNTDNDQSTTGTTMSFAAAASTGVPSASSGDSTFSLALEPSEEAPAVASRSVGQGQQDRGDRPGQANGQGRSARSQSNAAQRLRELVSDELDDEWEGIIGRMVRR